MPGLDGLAVCRRLRRKGWRVPILLLTARDARRRPRRRARRRRRRLSRQAVRGRGAAGARARAAAPRARRRPSSSRSATSSLDVRDAACATRAGRDARADARARPSCSSCCCATRGGRHAASSRSSEVWGGAGEATRNAVDRYVAYLRRKLGDPPLIQTVRGVGFVLGRDDPRSLRARSVAAAAVVDPRRARRARRSRVERPRRARAAPRRSTTRCAQRAGRRRAAERVGAGAADAPGALEAPLRRRRSCASRCVDRHGRIVARSRSLGGRVLRRRAARARGDRDAARPAYAHAALGAEPSAAATPRRCRARAAPLRAAR